MHGMMLTGILICIIGGGEILKYFAPIYFPDYADKLIGFIKFASVMLVVVFVALPFGAMASKKSGSASPVRNVPAEESEANAVLTSKRKLRWWRVLGFVSIALILILLNPLAKNLLVPLLPLAEGSVRTMINIIFILLGCLLSIDPLIRELKRR